MIQSRGSAGGEWAEGGARMAASARHIGRTAPPLEVCKLDEESACLGPSLTADWLSDFGFWGSDPLTKWGLHCSPKCNHSCGLKSGSLGDFLSVATVNRKWQRKTTKQGWDGSTRPRTVPQVSTGTSLEKETERLEGTFSYSVV